MWTCLHFSFFNGKSSVFETVEWWSLSRLLSSPSWLFQWLIPWGGGGGKEGKGGGRKRGRERAYQTTFKQNTVNHLSITPASLPSEQSSPHPHPCPLAASRWRSLVSISKSPVFLHFDRLLILFLISDIFSENEQSPNNLLSRERKRSSWNVPSPSY